MGAVLLYFEGPCVLQLSEMGAVQLKRCSCTVVGDRSYSVDSDRSRTFV